MVSARDSDGFRLGQIESGRDREGFRQGQKLSVRNREGFREGFTGFSAGTEKVSGRER
jgi:hypothetical protein